ncbi:heme-binding protein [Mycobacterium sp. AMU20-3851]|uniref:heme-binding protein n=1 Tax=Mycobacterium sp. AMU20-3851 TaxID=3122055 RepID=UPI0037548FB7
MSEPKSIEENDMVFDPSSARRVAAVALAALAVAIGTATSAAAEPPAQPLPPNCTAADLSGIVAGVTAATSAYLFTHPPVNDFFTSLAGKDQEQRRAETEVFMTANPQVRDELRAIRQPTRDFRNRCGV